MLSDGETTLAVFNGEDGLLAGLKQGGIVVQMGTLGVEATEQLIELTKKQRPDAVFFDAPVSGTKAPAEQAQIVVLASGDREAGAAVEPVFGAISKGVKWLGEAGRASKMKLVVNAWLISMVEGIAESAQLAEELGFTTDDLWNVLDGGPLAVPYIKGKMEMFKTDDYTPQMQLTWALKDINLALKASGSRKLPVMKTSVKPGRKRWMPVTVITTFPWSIATLAPKRLNNPPRLPQIHCGSRVPTRR